MLYYFRGRLWFWAFDFQLFYISSREKVVIHIGVCNFETVWVTDHYYDYQNLELTV